MTGENLENIVIRATRGEYYLPEIQRSFIWKSEQVRKLCDSLYKGYPVSVLLLWDNPNYVQPQRGAPNRVRHPLWIIDGQQRITSLCLLFGQKPYWYGPEEWQELRDRHRIFMNINLSNGNVEFSGRLAKQGWKGVLVQEVLGKREEGEIIDLAQRISEGDLATFHRILKPLLHLWNCRQTSIPIMQIMGREPEEVAEIFDRVNRAGTRVKETDTRLALITSYNPGWRRDEFDPFLQNLEERGWDIPPGYLLQAMIVFYLGKARVSEVTPEFWKQEILGAWSTLKEAVDEVVTFLWDKGIPAIDLIPSEYTLIPLFAMHAKFKRTRGYSFDQAYRWFLIANWEGRYSGAPLEKLTGDAHTIYHSQTLDEAINNMPPEESVSQERLMSLFREDFRRGDFGSLILHLLLWERDAHDWLQPLTLQAASTNNGVLRPHWHHIIPKAWAKRTNFNNAEWVANVTILTESTNVRRLGARPPWEYVPRNNISQQALEEHFIPEKFVHRFINGDPLTQEEFSNFLDERASLLATEAARYLSI